jgi:hypothetical protein
MQKASGFFMLNSFIVTFTDLFLVNMCKKSLEGFYLLHSAFQY